MGYQKYGYQKYQVSYQIYRVLDILGIGNIGYQKYLISEILGIRNIRYQIHKVKFHLKLFIYYYYYLLTKPRYVFDFRSEDQSRSLPPFFAPPLPPLSLISVLEWHPTIFQAFCVHMLIHQGRPSVERFRLASSGLGWFDGFQIGPWPSSADISGSRRPTRLVRPSKFSSWGED